MTNQDLPPHVQLVQMGTAYWVSSLLYAAAELGIADHLAEPRSAAEIAPALGVDAPALHRVMRTLASIGVLSERDERRFALTPLGAAMRSDAPGCARSTLRTLSAPLFMRPLMELPYSIKTGKPSWEKTHGAPIFDWFGQHPEEAARFSETMIGIHGREPAAVAAAYDFSTVETIVDVGGASGSMLAAILTRHARSRAVLFDLPQATGDAQSLLHARGVNERITIEHGDFFKAVPTGGDCYILSHIIHDWPEAECLAILGNVRRAMRPTGRVLIIESVLPAGDTPHFGKILDMVMLTIPGGQERTEREYGSLVARAGFRLQRVVPTESDVSVVEAVPA